MKVKLRWFSRFLCKEKHLGVLEEFVSFDDSEKVIWHKSFISSKDKRDKILFVICTKLTELNSN